MIIKVNFDPEAQATYMGIFRELLCNVTNIDGLQVYHAGFSSRCKEGTYTFYSGTELKKWLRRNSHLVVVDDHLRQRNVVGREVGYITRVL